MADDRPLEDTTDAVARLTRDLEDLRSTVLVRIPTRPTGDIEPTFLTTPKPGTLLCNGQAVSRTTYAGLWQWAQDNGRVTAGLFTVGDGVTTFGLPNLAGRFLVGAGTLGADTYAVGATGGATLKTLTEAQMPSHTHTGTTANDTHNHGSVGDHSHGGSGALGAGGHGGHFPGTLVYAPDGADVFGMAAYNSGGVGSGDHNHTLSLSGDGGHQHSDDTHSHTMSLNDTGGDTAFDGRPAYLAINVAVWT